ncbi:hypothetical protein N7495_000125 [Penicillium taxi]|uniref:uncharacterized protein n=1 Tax=Penicillium taxi TaxID=168475 RepID=UPI0025451CD1|nr:uncharacterized protein N7495_000125 [Penicillium taxi]KAJ5907443.1 hypothetical protein N7495_000125 [Penicillium taxi]
MSVTLILGFAAATVFVQVVRLVLTSWQRSQKARSLGCASPPHYPGNGIIGYDNFKASIRADKAKTIPNLWEERLRTVSEKENRFVTTLVTRNLGRKHLFTTDPKNIQAVLATQFKDFEMGSVRASNIHHLLGTGVFTADGEDWSRSRALLRPQFTRDQISQLELEETHFQNAMQVLPVAANGWTDVKDIQTIFFRLTMDSATEFLLGESVDSQLEALKTTGVTEKGFAYHFDRAQWVCAQRLRFEKLGFLVTSKETKESDKAVHDFVDKFVLKALNQAKNKKPADEEKAKYVFIDALAAATQDPIELRSQSLNILLAGRDTTASLLSWTILMLARQPEVFRKLRESIIDTFGTYSSPQNLTFAALKSCQYLQYCMNESLRLFPVVPVNRRDASRDTTLPRGGGPDGESPIFLKKGQSLIYSTHCMHRREDIWGADAAFYKPDRWFNRKVGWEYIPFNGGPRICIGQQFALTEAGYVLVRLLQRFDKIEDVNPDREIRWRLTLTSCPADLVTVRLHQADDA